MSARRHIKRLIRLEKKGLRKATVERIRELRELAVSFLGVLEGKEKKVSNLESERGR